MKLYYKLIIGVLFLWIFMCSSTVFGQDSRRVLFIGNSYTAYNNLPQLIHDVALSVGDTLIYDSNTPGGFRLLNHATNTTTKNQIEEGGWNYVVIQGQSREPILYPGEFNNGAIALYSRIKEFNPCAVTMTYMSWGRENGDETNCVVFPSMCTYEEMDSLLMLRYIEITEGVSGEVSPVSAVWRYLRENHPSIDLYASDGSHPSPIGSYAAACCFYSSIFKKDPTAITFDFSLDANTAELIRMAAKIQVYDQLSKWDLKKSPKPEIKFTMGPGDLDVHFISSNPGGLIMDINWDFGDGNSTSTVNPLHTFESNGTYNIQLSATTCDLNGFHTEVADTTIQLCNHTPSVFNSKDWICYFDTLLTEEADSYQWYAGFNPIIGETKQYLANYWQHNTAGVFSVKSTIGGCTEISPFYNPDTPPFYYLFKTEDGDPCEGDTIVFNALKGGQPLSDMEIINWYQNGNLLSNLPNSDTFLITEPGIYECSVVNPFSTCPLDTFYSQIFEFSCVVGIEENSNFDQELDFNLFPNPATESVTIECTKEGFMGSIQIHDITGKVLMKQDVSENITIDIKALNPGLYFVVISDVEISNSLQTALKLIKH